MSCGRCAGLMVPDEDDYRCINCGHRQGEAMGKPKVEKVEMEDEADSSRQPSCAAPVRGGGHCGTPRIMGELYCRRHLESMKAIIDEADKLTAVDLPEKLCTKLGCTRAAAAGRSYCEEHFKKKQQNNRRYRQNRKEALNGVEAESLEGMLLLKLRDERERCTQRLTRIDQLIDMVRGL